jgi:hypothetical protein
MFQFCVEDIIFVLLSYLLLVQNCDLELQLANACLCELASSELSQKHRVNQLTAWVLSADVRRPKRRFRNVSATTATKKPQAYIQIPVALLRDPQSDGLVVKSFLQNL